MDALSTAEIINIPQDYGHILGLILGYIGRLRRRDPVSIDPRTHFNELGIDSLDAITLTCDLERDLGFAIDPALVLEHPTPHAFAIHLASCTDSA